MGIMRIMGLMGTKRMMLLVLALGGPALAADVPVLRVYMPRSARPACEVLTLGELAIVRCDDEQRLAAACAVQLGRCPQPREKLVIDRNTVLVRLAAAGFRGKAVVLTGSSEIAVQRDENRSEHAHRGPLP